MYAGAAFAPKITVIGDGFKKDATQLEKLLDYKNDEKVLKQLLEIKSAKKMELKKALMEKQNVTINENSIFDIQIKRLHEYKRQQLNALYVIHKYLEIKAGKKPSTPIREVISSVNCGLQCKSHLLKVIPFVLLLNFSG